MSEQVLRIVVDNIDEKKSVAPLRIMRLNKALRRYVIDSGKHKIEKYLTYHKSSRFVRDGGNFVSMGEFPHAIIVDCVGKLPEDIGNHGFSVSIVMPFAIIFDETTNDSHFIVHPRSELARHQWYAGRLHGEVIRVHYANRCKNPEEYYLEYYNNGVRCTESCRMKKLDDTAQHVYVVCCHGDNTSTNGLLPVSYKTRQWNEICRGFSDKLMQYYYNFLADDESAKRLLGITNEGMSQVVEILEETSDEE